MILIDKVIQELIDCSTDWTNGVLEKDMLNLKLELLVDQLELIEINYAEPLGKLIPEGHHLVFERLLYSTKFKAKESLTLLINTTDKRSYKARINWMLKNKLYFYQLHKTLKNQVFGHIDRNSLKMLNPEFQIFITKQEKEGADNDNE